MIYKGFRELTNEEIEYVSGGYREWPGTGGTYHYYPPGYDYTGGGAGGGGGWGTEQPPEPGPPPQPSDFFKMAGLNCETDFFGFNGAVADLAYASPLGKQLIDQAQKDGWTIHIIATKSDSFSVTDQAYTAVDAKIIYWDPWAYIETVDDNGKPDGGYVSSTLVLAHELAHAVLGVARPQPDLNPDGSPTKWDTVLEKQIILDYEHQIANDLNAKFGKDFGVNNSLRTNHDGAWKVSNQLEKASFSIERPGCKPQ